MLFPVGSMPEGPPLQMNHALVLIDFQNDFVDADGKIPVANTAQFLDKLPHLVNKFRSKGDVIWVRTEYSKPRETISSTTGSYAILLSQFLNQDDSATTLQVDDVEAFLAPGVSDANNRPCVPKSSGVDYPERLASQIDHEKDIAITKTHYSAFVETPLLLQLRTRMINHLYVCGSLSNVSVYATVLDAVRHGLTVTLLEDCLGFRTETCHVGAMLQMVDGMGANGIDYQELMDDLAGLLGDIIHEQDFSSRFEVSLPSPTPSSHSRRASQPNVQQAPRQGKAPRKSLKRSPEHDIDSSKVREETLGNSFDSSGDGDSSRKSLKQSPEISPSRKRSTGGLDGTVEERINNTMHKSTPPETSHGVGLIESSRPKQPGRPRIRRPRDLRQASTISTKQSGAVTRSQTRSTGDLPNASGMSLGTDVERSALTSQSEPAIDQVPPKRKIKKRLKPPLGAQDTIGDGDCKLLVDIMSKENANMAFDRLRSSVKWQKMFHRSGEVPRLVAVQGKTPGEEKEIPIYRHPADESPELLPFDDNVNNIRQLAEVLVGHELNHVLIQWYRNGEDSISEHSDKSLDIVRGSNIVNVSFGAQRIMTLRTKKSMTEEEDPTDSSRKSQRIPLPHNSLFVLGEKTNQIWLHSIRPDKRPTSEKTPEELAFEGQRISLTFRNIGTFINKIENKIWGQGATSKTREDAQHILSGLDAEREGEAMIRAFGQENHRSKDWNWDEWYGKGFDVVNFETKPA